ncbi:hypothetical protein [Paracoccus methylarcula]|uniref:Uncharacterized protein n=1 Tax=Paracoccus methylarcula TaxID=72022 RepID=A0A422QXK9_9RHOB|nr:hypothetical protein [Paracoccus methylarcula]RNF34650.1 hypothetical protein A7A09_009510 [Paracoccus methylarcula]
MRHVAALIFCLLPLRVLADPPVVEDVRAERQGDGWRFDVTISHPDTGWDHYADAWRVLDMDGNELGLRILVHPHVDEQPFTRSLTGVEIPDAVTMVEIEARCLVDGWSGVRTKVELD